MKIIGHRGAKGLAPENTLAAYRKGLAHHVDEMEFDVRVTKDKIPVLHHDKHIHTPDGQRVRIDQTDYEDLKDHKPDLLTLQELLKQQDDVLLCLEVKPGELLPPIQKAIQASTHSRLQIASKSQKVLRALHHALPDIETVVIHPWSGVIATRRARQLGTKRISMNQLWLWSGFIAALTGGGYQLSAYTLNDPEKARRWSRSGLYGVVTDYPDQFKK